MCGSGGAHTHTFLTTNDDGSNSGARTIDTTHTNRPEPAVQFLVRAPLVPHTRKLPDRPFLWFYWLLEIELIAVRVEKFAEPLSPFHFFW